MNPEPAAVPPPLPDVLDLRDALRNGERSALRVTSACIANIDACDGAIQAWTHLDPEHARSQAQRLDTARESGSAPGPLHGLPVAIKDIIDTADMPTGNGCRVDAGRQPGADARVVARLRECGAVIMGKSVTTELAFRHPGKTRHPLDTTRTPGGSSSGSAAAVASHMVPLALGTQTGGSVIRPAAFCGIVGFKPSFGQVPRSGVLCQSHSLDTVGFYATSVDGVALLAQCCSGFDRNDSATRVRSAAALLETVQAQPPHMPRLAFVRQPAWPQADADMQHAILELVGRLGEHCTEVPLPTPFKTGLATHRTIHIAELAHHFARYVAPGVDGASDALREAIEEGRGLSAVAYQAALDQRATLYAGLAGIFEHYDAIITPAAMGQAPLGIESTGNPALCALWTMLGVPAVSLPLLHGADGMPIGVQLVGPRGDDARLLRTARWLDSHHRG